MNHTVRAPLAGALALVLATIMLTPFAGWGLIAAVTAVIILLSFGWPRLLELPSRIGSGVIIALTGLSAVAIASCARGHVPFSTLVITVIATAVFLSFFHEMFRKERSALTLSISGTASGALLSALMVTWLQAFSVASIAGPHAVVLLATLTCAIAISLMTLALPLSAKYRVPLAIVSAAVASAVLALFMGFAPAIVGLAAIAGVVISTAALSVFFLVERVIGAYDTLQFLALSTSLLPLVGVLEVLTVRLTLSYFPQHMGVAVLPSALGLS